MAIVRLYFHLEEHNRALHPPRNGRQHYHIRLATDFLPNSWFYVKRNGREDPHLRFAAWKAKTRKARKSKRLCSLNASVISSSFLK